MCVGVGRQLSKTGITIIENWVIILNCHYVVPAHFELYKSLY